MQEPGEVGDMSLGIPGPPEPLPPNDAEDAEPTLINEDDYEEDDDG